MPKKKGPTGPRKNSLANLEHEFFEKGEEQVSSMLKDLLSLRPDELFYAHIRFNEGQPASRTDATDDIKSVSYEHFDPPSFWQNPFQVMRVFVKPDKPTKFYYHDGEELLVPIDGSGVKYDFFWSEPGSGRQPYVFADTNCLVRPRHASRIHPQIPHRAWSDSDTRAWMITRPHGNSAAQIYVATRDKVASQATSRTIEESELLGLEDGQKNPSGIKLQYSLIGWGISEAIRQKRLRANLPVDTVAKRLKIDPGHLSKIEKGHTNVSLETLVGIFDILDIDLSKHLAPPSFAIENAPFPTVRSDGWAPVFDRPAPNLELIKDRVEPVFTDHFIHPQFLSVCDGQAVEFADTESIWPSAWITISGQAIVEFHEKSDRHGKKWNGNDVFLQPEGVLHLRAKGATIKKITPVNDCELIQILYDPMVCHCAGGINK